MTLTADVLMFEVPADVVGGFGVEVLLGSDSFANDDEVIFDVVAEGEVDDNHHHHRPFLDFQH